MDDSAWLVNLAINQTVSEIEMNSNDLQKCLEIILNTANTLHSTPGPKAIDPLVELLTAEDKKAVVLSMYYLGMLNIMGIDATRSIGPIRELTELENGKVVSAIAKASLAWIGDPEGLRLKAKFMKDKRISSDLDFNLQITSTIVKYILGILKD